MQVGVHQQVAIVAEVEERVVQVRRPRFDAQLQLAERLAEAPRTGTTPRRARGSSCRGPLVSSCDGIGSPNVDSSRCDSERPYAVSRPPPVGRVVARRAARILLREKLRLGRCGRRAKQRRQTASPAGPCARATVIECSRKRRLWRRTALGPAPDRARRRRGSVARRCRSRAAGPETWRRLSHGRPWASIARRRSTGLRVPCSASIALERPLARPAGEIRARDDDLRQHRAIEPVALADLQVLFPQVCVAQADAGVERLQSTCSSPASAPGCD